MFVSESALPTHRSRRALGIGVVAVVVVVATLYLVASYALRGVADSKPPYHPDNVSWRYGESAMQDKLYGNLDSADSVIAVCRAAMRRPVRPPTRFDVTEAVAGCRYGEWALDN